ncbi:GAF and ANTAR domain-containing protein [Kribbella sp. NPDC051770]|uniref:GAF and ANTAR domain-containing protein n=1 Tax=Kribbella sp. NPDC051770 TaxID=3155413 RepID=UPI00343797EE
MESVRAESPDLRQLAEVMTEVAASIQSPMALEKTLLVITQSAAETVPGIVEVSISLTRKDGRIDTLAPTGPLATQADVLQYELHEGPCLDAALGEPVVMVGDLATDSRWPEFGPRAAELGLGAHLAFQFRAEPHARGALNLYSTEPYGIDDDSVHLGSLFAGQVALAMGWARQGETMSEALATRNVIGQAVGIVMERYTLDDDRAFAFLARLSQSGNIKLRQVAAAIVEAANQNAQTGRTTTAKPEPTSR